MYYYSWSDWLQSALRCLNALKTDDISSERNFWMICHFMLGTQTGRNSWTFELEQLRSLINVDSLVDLDKLNVQGSIMEDEVDQRVNMSTQRIFSPPASIFSEEVTNKVTKGIPLSYHGPPPNLNITPDDGVFLSPSREDENGEFFDYGILANLGLDDDDVAFSPDDVSQKCLMSLPAFHYELDSNLDTSTACSVDSLPALLPSNIGANDTWGRRLSEWEMNLFRSMNWRIQSTTSKNPKIDIWEAEQYNAYPLSSYQVLHKAVIFFITTKSLQLPFQPSVFSIRVEAPCGPSITICVEKDRPKRLTCSFWANCVGSHLIFLMLNEKKLHVAGSPFFIKVYKDFEVEQGNGSGLLMNNAFIARNYFNVPNSALWGLTYNSATKQVYAADRHAAEILVFSFLNGEFVVQSKWKLPSNPNLPATFHPTGIALDSTNHRLLVTCKGNHCVIAFSLTGEYLFHFGGHGYFNGQFSYPWGIAVKPNGKFIVVADSRNHRLQLFDSSGVFIRKFSVFEVCPYKYRNEFDQPRGLCFDLTGSKIIVADFNLGRLFQFEPYLRHKMPFGLNNILFRPQGLSLDPRNGTLIVCDSRKNLIQCFSPLGVLIDTLHCIRSQYLEIPIAACICENSMCVVDRSGQRIRMID